MSNVRNLEDIRKELESRIAEYKAEIEAWRNVEILKKKDGSDFALKSKSFKNAKWYIESYSDEFHPKLKCYGRVGYRYVDFEIDAYIYTDNLPESDARKNLGKSAGSFMRPTYVFSVDEVAEAIKARIAVCEKRVANVSAQLAESEVIYNEFFGSVNAALAKMRETCKKFKEDNYACSLEYLLRDAMANLRF